MQFNGNDTHKEVEKFRFRFRDRIFSRKQFKLVFIKNIRLLNCIERILANIKKAVEFRFSLQFQRIFCLIL